MYVHQAKPANPARTSISSSVMGDLREQFRLPSNQRAAVRVSIAHQIYFKGGTFFPDTVRSAFSAASFSSGVGVRLLFRHPQLQPSTPVLKIGRGHTEGQTSRPMEPTFVLARNADAATTKQWGRVRDTAGRCRFLRQGSQLERANHGVITTHNTSNRSRSCDTHLMPAGPGSFSLGSGLSCAARNAASARSITIDSTTSSTLASGPGHTFAKARG